MVASALRDPLYIEVRLSADRSFSADVRRELEIDTKNILGEITSQPSKYARWATLVDLAQRKVDIAVQNVLDCQDDECFDSLVGEYIRSNDQYLFLRDIKEAFNHRKTALLALWENPGNQIALKIYRKKISNLRALKANMP